MEKSSTNPAELREQIRLLETRISNLQHSGDPQKIVADYKDLLYKLPIGISRKIKEQVPPPAERRRAGIL
jgi:hypothetical protein